MRQLLLFFILILSVLRIEASSSKDIVEEMISIADVKINGNRPWDIQIHDDEFYDRAFN